MNRRGWLLRMRSIMDSALSQTHSLLHGEKVAFGTLVHLALEQTVLPTLERSVEIDRLAHFLFKSACRSRSMNFTCQIWMHRERRSLPEQPFQQKPCTTCRFTLMHRWWLLQSLSPIPQDAKPTPRLVLGCSWARTFENRCREDTTGRLSRDRPEVVQL